MAVPLPLIAAGWGLCGATPYCGARLATALWSGAEVTPRARRLAVAQFAIAVFTGPAFAAALAPWLTEHARGASLSSVACFVGLFANAAWPVLTDRATVAKLLAGFGGWLLRTATSVEAAPKDAGPSGGSDER